MPRRHAALPPEIAERISHEEVSNLPVCGYEGPVHLVAAPRLTPQQITYAATDAWACRELYLRFRQLKLV